MTLGDLISARHELFGLLAAIALLVLPAIAIGLAGKSDGRASEPTIESAAATTDTVHPATAPSAHKAPRVAVSSTGVLIAGLLLGGLTLLSRFLERPPRPAGDVGDSWRSLLLGAPPLVA